MNTKLYFTMITGGQERKKSSEKRIDAGIAGQ